MVYPFRKDVFGGLFLIAQTYLAMIFKSSSFKFHTSKATRFY